MKKKSKPSIAGKLSLEEKRKIMNNTDTKGIPLSEVYPEMFKKKKKE